MAPAVTERSEGTGGTVPLVTLPTEEASVTEGAVTPQAKEAP